MCIWLRKRVDRFIVLFESDIDFFYSRQRALKIDLA